MGETTKIDSMIGYCLSYLIDDVTLINEISIEMKSGKFITIVGPNGAGKSTLLKILSGDINPTKGNVYLDDMCLTKWNKKALALRRSVLPQNSKLTFPFSVFEVVLMGRSPHERINKNNHLSDYSVVKKTLAKTGIEHLINRDYTSLSGGEKQRVQFARVLSQIWPTDDLSTNYLFLDEPTANLDPTYQIASLQIAKEFTKHNIGVLAVLHDINLAADFADEVFLLNAGKLIKKGIPEAVFTKETLEKVFDIEVLEINHPQRSCPVFMPNLNKNT